ncbi:MAG: hypothetical protein ACRD2C_26480 [Acidimicrobiales bacterium]
MTVPELVEALLPGPITDRVGVIGAAITFLLWQPALYKRSRCAYLRWKLECRRVERALREDERRYPPDVADHSNRPPPPGH